MENQETVYYRHRDGEEEYAYHPIASHVQGSLARERQENRSRVGKDRKEFALVRKLNHENRIPLIKFLNVTSSNGNSGKNADELDLIESKLSELGARYPNVPGLGIYIQGLQVLQGKGEAKRIFDLLHYIASLPDKSSYYKFILFEKLGRIILMRNIQGRWIENDRLLFAMLGKNTIAKAFAEDCLGNNPSAIADSLKNGKRYAAAIHIVFYANTTMYNPKVRKRGYARNSPAPSSSSKKARIEANTSLEVQIRDGLVTKTEEGECVFVEKKNIEQLIFDIFSNSLEIFEANQQKVKEREKLRDIGQTVSHQSDSRENVKPKLPETNSLSTKEE